MGTSLTPTRFFRRASVRWLLRGLVALFILVALYIVVLAFPGAAFAHKGRFGEFVVYSTQPLPNDLDRVLEELRVRVASMSHAEPGAECRIFICDARRYAAVAFLTRRGSDSIAIGLSVLGNVYVNQAKVRSLASHNPLRIRHSRYEGNLTEAVAHEIAHFNVVRHLGYRASTRIPVWKSEGYAEYQANLATTRADPGYRFIERIDLLRNDDAWGDAHSARRLFSWHVLVEFLAEEHGYDLDALLVEKVTEASARQEMFAWHDMQRALD